MADTIPEIANAIAFEASIAPKFKNKEAEITYWLGKIRASSYPSSKAIHTCAKSILVYSMLLYQATIRPEHDVSPETLALAQKLAYLQYTTSQTDPSNPKYKCAKELWDIRSDQWQKGWIAVAKDTIGNDL